MSTVTGHVNTPQATKHIKRLCNHWAHKAQVEQSEGAGTVHFPAGVIEFTSTPIELAISIKASDDSALPKIKEAVASHLDRMAWREAPLHIQWSA